MGKNSRQFHTKTAALLRPPLVAVLAIHAACGRAGVWLALASITLHHLAYALQELVCREWSPVAPGSPTPANQQPSPAPLGGFEARLGSPRPLATFEQPPSFAGKHGHCSLHPCIVSFPLLLSPFYLLPCTPSLQSIFLRGIAPGAKEDRKRCGEWRKGGKQRKLFVQDGSPPEASQTPHSLSLSHHLAAATKTGMRMRMRIFPTPIPPNLSALSHSHRVTWLFFLLVTPVC